MSRISKSIVAIFFILSVSRTGWSMPADETTEILARAEALYYEADFAKSIELLLRLDTQLRPQAGRLPEKVSVKLQLALGYVGLNDTARARDYFGELYALEADHPIDPQMFSPKIIQLAEEAKAQQLEVRCQTARSDAERQLKGGSADAVMKLIVANQKCTGFAPLSSSVADLFYKEGLDAFKKGQMAPALQKFRSAVQLRPEHEMAVQYLDLTQGKLQLDADRVLVAWRKDFNSREFAAAARDYRELVTVSGQQNIDSVRGEYRQVLSTLVESWNRACASDDTATMEDVRHQVNELMPDTSFAEDILEKMTMCTHTGCISMTSQLALARLRSRVDPEFSPYVRAQIKVTPITVRIKARISEKGDVVSSEPQGGNAILYSPIRAAFDRWKFSPAIVQGEARCVDTEIPIVITLTPAN